MYFSSKNKNHIFNIISDLIIKETGTDINSDKTYIDLYRFKYTLIFERSQVDNLVDLNKELIDEVVPLFINDIQSKYMDNNIKIKPAIQETIVKETKRNEKINYTGDPELSYKEFIIYSGDRIDDSINRFNYTVKLPDNISFLILKEVSIPEEPNILLGNPIICIQFKMNSKELNNFCTFDKSILLQNKKYNIYKPTTPLEIPFQNNLEIKILTNTLMNINQQSDKHSINKIKNIQWNNTDYLCIMTEKNNCKENDCIGIYCNDNLIKTMIISISKENYFLIENETLSYDTQNKYSFLELNLQNNLTVNYR